MNTNLLYYRDPYLREFAARVIGRRVSAGRPAVALDATAFYPTGGGQPNDTGTLNGVPVVDVVAEEGLVWHVLDGDAPEGQVQGVVDWDRRFDHMQQHSGQHILSQAFIHTLEAETVAFHLGSVSSTIDLNRIDLGASVLAAAEAAANAVIDAALPVTASFVTQAELARLPLRKPPKVTEDVRVVQVTGFDWSACGGTHVTNSAQIGLVKIVGTERRGQETRIAFLCGRRARADYARLQTLAEGLVARFTTGRDGVLDAVDRLSAEGRATRRELGEMEGQWVESLAAAWWAEAQVAVLPGARVIARIVDYPAERVKRIAQALRTRPGAVVLLGVRGERPQLIFARADDLTLNAGDLLRTAAAAGGGRGGGRPDWAQGGLPSAGELEKVLDAAVKALG